MPNPPITQPRAPLVNLIEPPVRLARRRDGQRIGLQTRISSGGQCRALSYVKGLVWNQFAFIEDMQQVISVRPLKRPWDITRRGKRLARSELQVQLLEFETLVQGLAPDPIPSDPSCPLAIEALLGRYLGVRKVLWLSRGIAGDDTNGHVDDIARFVAPGRVVAAVEDDPRDENYAPLEENRDRLARMTDLGGHRLTVVPMPMPRPLFFEGQRLPASYLNFYIGNRRVLVPTFNDPADRVALGRLADLFPDREVRGHSRRRPRPRSGHDALLDATRTGVTKAPRGQV